MKSPQLLIFALVLLYSEIYIFKNVKMFKLHIIIYYEIRKIMINIRY